MISCPIIPALEITKMFGLAESQEQETAHKGNDPAGEFLSRLVNSPDVPRPLNEVGESEL